MKNSKTHVTHPFLKSYFKAKRLLIGIFLKDQGGTDFKPTLTID